ncbi:hypothetical protein [Kitasatospora indigofera]|uniref:hypothetical protein n=1 Tax=Kitasatospora indigofera TaxID=67307 RepID=UPI00369B1A79
MTAVPKPRPGRPTGLTPRDLPNLRADLVDWYAGDAAARLAVDILQHADDAALQTAAERAGLAPDPLAEARAVNGQHRASLDVAGLYFVNEDMTDLAIRISEGLETFALLADEDLPEDHGLLIWARPPFEQPDEEEPRLVYRPVAVNWSAHGNTIDITAYEYRPAMAPFTRSAVDGSVRAAGINPATLPAMRALWDTAMTADGAEHDWDSTWAPDADTKAMLRVLLATWLLIRQPADAHKALHHIEEVPAPRNAQRRILRGGGDPTRTVRYVTLRQSLRRPDEKTPGGPEHADRVYRHRWFVRPHRVEQYYPSTNEHRRIWRGPYLVTPAGTEHAPILGTDRVNVLRR